jgi:hypothetical protein
MEGCSYSDELVRNGQRIMKTGKVWLSGTPIECPDYYSADLRRFLVGLKFGGKLNQKEIQLVDGYVETVRKRINDLFKLYSQARRRGLTQFDLFDTTKEEIKALAWSVSADLQGVMGWYVDLGATVNPNLLKEAGMVARYRSQPELEKIRKKRDLKFVSKRLLKYAVSNNYTDPEGFLMRVKENIERLMADPEFQELRRTPWLIKYASIYNVDLPEEFLRMVITRTDELLEKGDYKILGARIICRVVVMNTKDPEKVLKRKTKQMAELQRKPEFREFACMPWVFRAPLFHRNNSPELFMRKVSQQVAKLKSMREFAIFRDWSSSYYKAAISGRHDPENYLRKAKKKITDLLANPKFALLKARMPKIFFYAYFKSKEPEKYLEEFQKERLKGSNHKSIREALKRRQVK